VTRDRGRTGPLLGAALACLVTAGCATVAGPQQTQTRTIAAVGTVELSSSGDLVLTQGPAPSLRITAGENVIGHLTSSVHGDRLTLGSDGSLRVLGRVRYDLVLPAARTVDLSGSGNVHVSAPNALQQLQLPGSGNVRVDGLRSGELTVDLSGSGQVAVAGSVSRQQISISGSGRYSGGGLASQDAVVTIGGSGSADVSAERTLAASISGSGAITYTGDADVTTSVTGSGSVVHR
jgi:hypothetical protein